MLSRSQRIAAFFGRTYILAAASVRGYEIRHACFFNGMYWLQNESLPMQWHPLLKDDMAKTSLELVNATQNYSGASIRTKIWVPLDEKMQAFYDMMPDAPTEPTNSTGSDPQMPG